MTETPIDAIAAHDLSREAFEAVFGAGPRPLVIRGGMTDAPAWRLWTNEYLVERAGHRSIRVTSSETSTFNPNADAGMGRNVEHDETFADSIRIVTEATAAARHYVMQQSVPDKLPELVDDVPAPRWLPERAVLARVNLWFGTDTTTPLHFDSRHNFLGMVRGRKHCSLYSPADTPNLYPATTSRRRHVSQVDAVSPDLARFPRFKDARAITATLDEGDLLFIPSRWWHLVRSLGTSLSVNYWWDTRETSLARAFARARRQASAGGESSR